MARFCCYFAILSCLVSDWWNENIQNTHLGVYFERVCICVCRFLLNSFKISIQYSKHMSYNEYWLSVTNTLGKFIVISVVLCFTLLHRENV